MFQLSQHEFRTVTDQFDWDYDHFIDRLRVTRDYLAQFALEYMFWGEDSLIL